MARVTPSVGLSKSSTRVLIETSISPHAPLDSWRRVRSRVLPSFPMTCPTRFSSWAICWLAATIELNVSAIFPGSPVHDPGSRTEKSPFLMICRLARIVLRSLEPGPAAVSSTCTEFPFRPFFGLSPGASVAPAVVLARLLFFIKISCTGGGSGTSTKDSTLAFQRSTELPPRILLGGEGGKGRRARAGSCGGTHYRNQG